MASRLPAWSMGMLPSAPASTSKRRVPVFLSKKMNSLGWTEKPLAGGRSGSNFLDRLTGPLSMKARPCMSPLGLRSHGTAQPDSHRPLGLFAVRDFVEIELHAYAVGAFW